MRFSNRAVAVGLVALVAAGARGGVVITEIMYNPAGPDGVTPRRQPVSGSRSATMGHRP